MAYLLYINDERLDLFSDEDNVLAMTYAVNNLLDIRSRQEDYSNDGRLPLTARNCRLLGLPQDIKSYTRVPYRLNPCRIEDGGLTVNGTMRIVAVTDAIEFEIRGGNADFFRAIEGKTLRELVLGHFDHDWTLQTVRNSAAHDYTKGYTYPAVDYGRFADREYLSGLAFEELYPAVFARAVFQALLEQAGFVARGGFVSDATFAIQLLAANTPPQYDSDFIEARSCKVGYDPAQSLTARRTALVYDKVETFLSYNYAGTTNGRDDGFYAGSAGNYNPAMGWYRADAPMFVRVDMGISLNVKAVEGKHSARIVLIKGINDIVGEVRQQYRSGVFGRNVNGARLSKTVSGILLQAGEYLRVKLIIERDSTVSLFETDALLDKQCYFEVKPLSQVPAGGRINLSALLPEMKQTDFLLTLVNQYNLLIRTRPEEGVVQFDKFNTVTDNLPNAKDWTRKVDYSEAPELEFLQDGYGQESTFAYAEDQADSLLTENRTYGRGIIQIDNQNLPLQETVFESEFAATLARPTFTGGAQLPCIPIFKPKAGIRVTMYQSDTEYRNKEGEAFVDYVIYNSLLWKCSVEATAGKRPGTSGDWQVVDFTEAYDQEEPAPRMLVRDSLSASPVYIVDPTDPDTVYEYINNATFAPLEFSNLLANNYGGLKVALQLGKYLRVLVKLTAYDIATLDYLYPVFIGSNHPVYGDRLNAYFYIQAINQYKHGAAESCWVDLLRVDYESASILPPVPEEDVAALLQETEDFLLTEAGGLILIK